MLQRGCFTLPSLTGPKREGTKAAQRQEATELDSIRRMFDAIVSEDDDRLLAEQARQKRRERMTR